MLIDSYKESAEALKSTPDGRAMLAAISCLETELKEAKDLLLEVDEHLSDKGQLECGSILANKVYNVGRA